MIDFKNVLKVVHESQNFFITSHLNPDSDALGSMLGLALGLLEINKNVFLYNRDGVPRILQFMPGSIMINTSFEKIDEFRDVLFILDCSNLYRVGDELAEKFNEIKFCSSITIDHHDTHEGFADISIIDKTASSTGMIVYKLLKSLGVKINKDIATNIYATIVGDTGSFKYSNTTPETLNLAAELMGFGADPESISKNLYENESVNKLQLLSLALLTLEISNNKKIASVSVTESMFKNSCTEREDSEGLINYPRSINGIEVAVLFREEDHNGNSWKISLRSKGDTDVAKIAGLFGGGGHKKAAGCTIDGKLDDVKKKIYSAINKELL